MDEQLYGKREGGNNHAFLAVRLALLPPAQVAAMDVFVARKLRERDEGGLVDWYEESAEARLPPNILMVACRARTIRRCSGSVSYKE